MIVESQGKRYASLADHERGRAMSPRELVEDLIRRKTDGTLTFELAEDEYSVVAMFRLDGKAYTQGWSKSLLAGSPDAADEGLRLLLAKANATASPRKDVDHD